MEPSVRRRVFLVLFVVLLSLHLVAATLIALGTASEGVDPLGKGVAGYLGATAGTSAGPPLETACGSVSGAIVCGQAINASTASSVNVMANYSCIPQWDESGPEQVWSLTLPPGGPWHVEAWLSNMTADLDVFMLGPGTCDSNACVAGGDAFAMLDGAAGGAAYYIAVDGYLGAISAYTLSLSCTVTDGWLEGQLTDLTSQPPGPPCTPAHVHVDPLGLDIPVDPGTGSYGPVALLAGTYDLTATAVNYPYPLTMSAIAVVAGTTTTANFSWSRAAAGVSPSNFVGIQGTVGVQFTEIMTIINDGYWEMDWVVLEAGGDLPWVSESPISGTIPGPSQYGVDVTFLCPSVGDFSGSLLIEHSDPCTPGFEIPILLSCFPPSGWIEGQVRDGAAHPPGPPCAPAWVEVAPIGHTIGVDPATGHYGPEMLPEGSYDLSGWAVGYPVPALAPGVAVVAGTTTTQDLDLERPAAAVTPSDFLGVTGVVNEPFSETLTILNDGTWELDWEILESDGNLPWVWESPTTGTVPASSQFGVEVGFLCPDPGDFYGDLLVLHSDPCTPGFEIPIWLNCDSQPPDIFADGFESGDTTAWSFSVP